MYGVQRLDFVADVRHHYHHRRLLSFSFVIIFIVIITVDIILVIIIPRLLVLGNLIMRLFSGQDLFSSLNVGTISGQDLSSDSCVYGVSHGWIAEVGLRDFLCV